MAQCSSWPIPSAVVQQRRFTGSPLPRDPTAYAKTLPPLVLVGHFHPVIAGPVLSTCNGLASNLSADPVTSLCHLMDEAVEEPKNEVLCAKMSSSRNASHASSPPVFPPHQPGLSNKEKGGDFVFYLEAVDVVDVVEAMDMGESVRPTGACLDLSLQRQALSASPSSDFAPLDAWAEPLTRKPGRYELRQST